MAIVIDRAGDAEAPAAIALLPSTQNLPCEWLIARRDGRLAGAAAIVWRGWSDPAGFPVALEVIADHRRQGVGRALIEAVTALADGECGGLWTLAAQPLVGPAQAFLRATGFQPLRRQRRFEADLDPLIAQVAPLAARARRSAPSQARIVPLAEAPLEEIGWLLSEAFGGGPARALHGLRRRAGDANDRSLVAMDGEAVAGALMWRIDDDVAIVDARVVARQRRGAWSNLLLLDAGLAAGKAASVRRMQFHCDDTVSDTVSLARRAGADDLEAGAYYYAALAS
jgi:GNAT superfamily N-acetyltransferase